MREFSVAIVCHDVKVADRLLHCLEFMGVTVALRDRVDAVTEDLLLTDATATATSASRPVITIGAGDCSNLSIAWPPRVHDVAATLDQARTYMNAAGMNGAPQFPELVGPSDALCQVRELMRQVADSDATVLITGESGTGKEVVARSLHRASRRRGEPFVPVNCAAIPSELLESELFGHEKGAFTGALDAKKGRFELAHNGTLFLDEIGDMPLTMQVKLLRAIQDKCVERVGSARSTPCDVRIVAATHHDLESLIEHRQFREDLYYRLAVFPIAVPALRERRDDVRPIAHHVLARLEREQRGSLTLTEDAWRALGAYDWPGNVRELCNLLERLVVQYPGARVDVADLPLRLRSAGARLSGVVAPSAADAAADGERAVVLPVNGIDLRAFLADMERSLIQQALDDTESVVARAADRLQIRRTTLVEKMRKYGIRREAV